MPTDHISKMDRRVADARRGKFDARGQAALDRFRENLDIMSKVWQTELVDDENCKDMRRTAREVGLVALLRAALRLLESGDR
jgi:hypothetical protein